MSKVSDQWRKLAAEEFAVVDDTFLDSFRAPGASNKFVAWDPFERSSRYFKFLLFNTASQQSPTFFDAYRAIRQRDVGHPISVRCRGCEVDADYLAAVEEWEFLHNTGALEGTSTVIEIGAGFGRTCHTLLTLCPQIRDYIIIDLEPMLRLSRAYLERVIPGAPVTFIQNDQVARVEAIRPDLVINIDSFQEMPSPVIGSYMEQVVSRGDRFYCKNPVGKYAPPTVGLDDVTPDRLMDVFRLGYCQDVLDIFDDADLTVARERFLEAYQPPSGGGGAYRVAASKAMALFPYFLHVLYSR